MYRIWYSVLKSIPKMPNLPPRKISTSNKAKQDASPLQILLQMGFPKHRAQKALAATGNRSVQLASDWLLTHVNDTFIDADEPREYIFYASPTGPLLAHLLDFWKKSKAVGGWNGAHNFPPHITLVSFFKAPDETSLQIAKAVKNVVESVGDPPNCPLKLEPYISHNFMGLFVSEQHADYLKKIAVQYVKQVSAALGVTVDTYEHLDVLGTCFPWCAMPQEKYYKCKNNQCDGRSISLSMTNTFGKTAREWILLPAFVFPDAYNLGTFKARVNKFLLAINLEAHVKSLHITLAYHFDVDAYDPLKILVEELQPVEQSSWELRLYSRDPRFVNHQVYKVTQGYEPKASDELELVLGDYIYIEEKEFESSPDGWVHGTSWLTGVSGYLPGVYTQRTAESDAWTLHRAISLGNNGSESKSESDSNTDGEMATSYPHEDASQLGFEKSEEIYRDWDKYWKAIQLDKSASILTITQGTAIDWKADTMQGNGYADSDKQMAKGQNRRWIFSMRHGERVDLTYGQWVQHCFDNDTYVRKDLNMPLKLGERMGGKESYAKDTPLTRVGRLQAQLVGEGLRLAGVDVRHVYASSALRCVETAHAFLEGLQADPSVKIKVEPGLFEYKMWHAARGISFMTPIELHKSGLNVDLAYKPYVELDMTCSESLEEFYNRGEFVMHSAYNDTETEDGSIMFVGHAATLDMMAFALQRIGDTTTEREPYQIYKNLLKVPYCALAAVRDKPLQLVPPPCPPSINSNSGRYDWKILQDIWKS